MDHNTGMLFAGDTGAGKTHYACSVANEVMRNWSYKSNVEVLFFNMNLNLPQLLDNRYFKRYDPYTKMLYKLETCTLLIVDDLLHISDVEWAKEVLYRVYEARYANELRTITTLNANLFPDGNQADWSPISDRFNEAFMRRVVDSASKNIILV